MAVNACLLVLPLAHCPVAESPCIMSLPSMNSESHLGRERGVLDRISPGGDAFNLQGHPYGVFTCFQPYLKLPCALIGAAQSEQPSQVTECLIVVNKTYNFLVHSSVQPSQGC